MAGLLLAVLLAASLAYSGIVAIRANDAERKLGEVCRIAEEQLGWSLGGLTESIRRGSYEIYGHRHGGTLGYLGILNRCPQSPVEGRLFNNIDRFVTWASFSETGFWNDTVARGALADGFADLQQLLLADADAAAHQRTVNLADELDGMGYYIANIMR